MQDSRERTAALLSRPSILREGETCWRMAHANRFAMIVDAAEYFAAARDAMINARNSIVLVGWDFDLRIKLVHPEHGRSEGDDWPVQLGAFLTEIVRRRPNLEIYVLKWDMALIYTLSRQLMPLGVIDLIANGRTHLRFDSTHPWLSAHHQKIAVIDDALAFCGGIDMTTGRWDTRDHTPMDPRRCDPGARQLGPWHDATVAVDGEAARTLGHLTRERWRLATGERLRPPAVQHNRDVWPTHIEAQLRDVHVGIARTMPPYEGREAVHEVEALYLAAIKLARNSIYIESQYFASVAICDALAKRLGESDGPEVIVVNPRTPEGWLEEETMGVERDMRMAEILAADRDGRFRIYYPQNADGEEIYVHAKIVVVDDELLRVGSSNVNNRSMGFDSECDLAVEASSDDERIIIARMRNDLLAEHLGVDRAQIEAALAAEGTVRGAIEALLQPEGRTLKPIPVRPVNAVETAVARSRAADPERPAQLESRASHVAKRIFLQARPSVWASVMIGLSLGALDARRLSR